MLAPEVGHGATRRRVSVPVGGLSIGACSRHMNVDSDRRSPPCALVIFGASGDLTARKLLPRWRGWPATGRCPPRSR